MNIPEKCFRLPAVQVTTTRQAWVVHVALMAMAMLCYGCDSKESDFFILERIGKIEASQQDATMSDRLFVHEGVTNWTLGISVPGGANSSNNPAAVAEELSRLKLRIELYHGAESNAFWWSETELTNNLAYYPLWRPDCGFLVGGGAPFPFNWPGGRGSSISHFRDGKDAFPLSSGQLVPHTEYTMRVKVLVPTAFSNRLDVWIYGVGQAKPVGRPGKE